MNSPLYEHALKLLTRRPHSVNELSSKLLRVCRRQGRKRTSPFREDELQSVIEALVGQGQLDDVAFSAWYREQRQTFRPKAKVVLRHELASRGVASPIVQDQLDLYDENEACRALARKKAHMPRDRLVTYLLRNGFSYGTIRSALYVVDREEGGGARDGGGGGEQPGAGGGREAAE